MAFEITIDNMKDITFKSLTNKKDIDLIGYIQHHFEQYPEDKLYIGTDSQNMGNYTVYGIVLVLHRNNRGGHVLYTTIKLPRINDKHVRLWKEVEYSVELAEFLKESKVRKPEFIDVDFNADPKYASNTLLRSALGFIEGMGYTARAKPFSLVASYVADIVCR